jgi:hypothetical protein
MRGRERRRRGRLRSLCEEAGADTRDLEIIGETEHWSCRLEVTGHDKPGQKTVSPRVDHSAAFWRCRATIYAVKSAPPKRMPKRAHGDTKDVHLYFLVVYRATSMDLHHRRCWP